MNTIPCVYVATMKTCTFGDRCKNVHYAVQLTNCKYCSGCSDVVVEGNSYKNKNRGRVCLFKHEKESHVNYIKRTNLSVEQPPIKKRKIDMEVSESPKQSSVEILMKVEEKLGKLKISNKKPLVPTSASLEDFPVLEVFVKKRQGHQLRWPAQPDPVASCEQGLPLNPDLVASCEQGLPLNPDREPVVEITKVEESKVITKKDKKKEYKKRKWLETKLEEEAKIAQEKRVAEEKAEKKRQKRAAKKLRQQEVSSHGVQALPASTAHDGDTSPTIEELKKAFKKHMLKERINELKKARSSKA
jgi:hypothetical protein